MSLTIDPERVTTIPLDEDAGIRVEIVETIVRVFTLTASELEDLALPATLDDLREADADDVAVTLIDNAEETSYSVTDRDISISDASPASDD